MAGVYNLCHLSNMLCLSFGGFVVVIWGVSQKNQTYSNQPWFSSLKAEGIRIRVLS